MGSPPRMRGIRGRHGGPGHHCMVHPRVCGEYRDNGRRRVQTYGSPPRMRGILYLCPPYRLHVRFTPAYAGNTSSGTLREALTMVHPRVCGEYRGAWNGSLAEWGFTPAYAGNTSRGKLVHPRRRVHPRVCGEYASVRVAWLWPLGSPPRMRGIRIITEAGVVHSRFTPAYAGNTLADQQVYRR